MRMNIPYTAIEINLQAERLRVLRSNILQVTRMYNKVRSTDCSRSSHAQIVLCLRVHHGACCNLASHACPGLRIFLKPKGIVQARRLLYACKCKIAELKSICRPEMLVRVCSACSLHADHCSP